MNRSPLLTKVAALVLAFLLVNVALSMIQGLVNERRWRGVQAARSVKLSMAGRQTLLGPLIQRNCTETWSELEEAAVGQAESKLQQRRLVTRNRSFVLAAAPQRLQVESQLTTQPRYRGIFKINGYAGHFEFQATWPNLNALQPQVEHAGSQLSCEPVRVWVAADDVRGLRSAQARVDGASLAVQPGTPIAKNPHGLQFALDAVRSSDGASPLSLELLGTTRLALVPAARETRWALRSDWPHPSFGGDSCLRPVTSHRRAPVRNGWSAPCPARQRLKRWAMAWSVGTRQSMGKRVPTPRRRRQPLLQTSRASTQWP